MIHYHGTPCGGTRDGVSRFLSGRHALIPWPRPEDLPTAMEVCQSFCVDNGAYTAWKSGQPITECQPYFDWVEGIARHPGFDFAMIPDVIDGTVDDNDKLLARWYHKVSPRIPSAVVWHMHEPLDRLRHLCERHRSNGRVAWGSSGDYRKVGTLKWWNRIEAAMKVACDERGRPLHTFHGLRMLDPAVFHRLPFKSADSTNAVRNANLVKRFGMYAPPALHARMTTIAERIEAHQSAAIWEPREKVLALFELGESA